MTIELHTWNTPNGRKISVALEEMGLPYKVFPINISKGEQMGGRRSWPSAPTIRSPAIVDPDGPRGPSAVSVFGVRRHPALSRREDRQVPARSP